MSLYPTLENALNVWASEEAQPTDTPCHIDDTDMSDETAVSDLVMVPDTATGAAGHGSTSLFIGGRTSHEANICLMCERVGSPDTENMHTPKRVAISGPSQHALDDLCQREEITRQRAVQHGIRLQNQRQEIWHLCKQLASHTYCSTLEGELENQMIDQIIQPEKQIQSLTSCNADLTNILKDGGCQLQDLQHHNNDIQQKLNVLTMECEQEKERQKQEVLALCQRLQVAESAQSNLQDIPANIPRVMRGIFTRNTPARVVIVPLRPVHFAPNPSASPAPESESDSIDLNTPSDVSNVKAIVKEVLSQLNVTKSMVTDSPSRKPRRSSACTRNQQAKSIQRQTLARSDYLEWMAAVRNFWKTSFGVTSISDFSQYEPAPANRVNAFKMLGQNGPDSSNILNFQKGYNRSRWNKAILTRLCTQILEECGAEGNWGLPDVSDTYIMSLLYSQLKQSQEAWSLVQARPNVEQNRMETDDDVIEHVTSYTTARLDAIGSRTRSEHKYQRQMKATDKIIVLKLELDAPDLDTWKYFCKLLTRLSVNGMSSEEEGVEKIGHVDVPVFRVKLCIWRHAAVRDYFKYIDSESQSPAIQPRQGSKLQPRIMTNKPGQTQAPHNLPEKLFDPEWLKSMKELKGQKWVEDELQVSQDVFKLLQFTTS